MWKILQENISGNPDDEAVSPVLPCKREKKSRMVKRRLCVDQL